MRVDEILDRLERVKRNGTQWVARCPAHEDKRPSLSIREDGDVVLLHCFAGCRVDDICRRLGIEISDLFNRPLPERRPPVRRKNLSKVVQLQSEYVKALLYDEERLGMLCNLRPWSPSVIADLGLGFDATTKRITFPVRDHGTAELLGHLRYSPIGEEPKMIADSGVPRQLFPEPRLLPEEGLVWIVEGEPDAVTMWSMGCPALGVPGVQAWKSEWAEQFAGRDVGILCDSDEQGRALARDIHRSVLPLVRSVAMLDIEEVWKEQLAQRWKTTI